MYIFSIIIPVFNTEKYLKECIDSIIKQSNKNFEIILIDDGSADRSGEICDLYQKKEPRVKVIHQDNEGTSKSRNCGLNIATGKYVMFMDSDDYLENNNVITDFVNIFEKHNCDIIYGVYKGFIDNDYKSCTYKIYPKILKIDNAQIKNLNTEEVIQLLFDNGNYYSSSTIKIYRRDYLESNRFRFKSNIYLEDEEWTPRILLNCKKIYFYSKEFYMRRIREDSIMTTINDERQFKKIVDMIEIASDMTKYTESKCKNEELRKTFKEYYKAFASGYINLYNEINGIAIKSKAKTIIQNVKKL